MYEEIQPFLDKTSANLQNGTCFIKSKSTLCMRLLTLEPDRPPDKIDPSLRTFYPKQGFTSSLARSLQPCANENFRHTKSRLSAQPLQPKMLMNIGSSSGQTSSCIPPFPGDRRSIQPCFAPEHEWILCVLPAQEISWQQGWKPINHFKPSAASSLLKGITDGLTKSLLWWRDGRNQSWRSVPGW